MWNLAVYLPVLIGDRIPFEDDHWECYLLLLDIPQLCTTKTTSSAYAEVLEVLIHDHHALFTRCYPRASIIPKMHYMVHFPRQIIRYIQYCSFLALAARPSESGGHKGYY